MATAVNVFISYAHEDAALKDQLLQHLAGLVNDGVIRVWHDRDIQGGQYWVESIDNALEISSVVLLLISPSFLASRYAYGSELRRALRRASAGEATVIPIILRPANWQTSVLRDLQALPHDGKAVTSWPNRDEAFVEVIQGLKTVIAQLQLPAAPTHPETGATASGTIRYYLYISDAKIDMLLPQIAGASSTNAVPRTEEARIQRLNVVLHHVERNSRIGTIDEPGEYIHGVEKLLWGHFHQSDLPDSATTPPIVAFYGTTPKTALLMCGTTRHMVGSHQPEHPRFSSSHAAYLLNELSRAVELEESAPDSSFHRDSGTSEGQRLSTDGHELPLSLIDNARGCIYGVEQRLEFLAKPLLSGPGRDGTHQCLLASPLYVALGL
jgi:hypothetical protein